MIDTAEGSVDTTPEDAALIDAVILASAPVAWSKIAVVIARATDLAKERDIVVTPRQIAARIYALTDAGKLAVQGNVRRWRTGEVRAVAGA
jgi:hypothetical protein